jgi:phospholipase B1
MKFLVPLTILCFGLALGLKAPLSEQYLKTIKTIYGLDVQEDRSEFLEFALKDHNKRRQDLRELIIPEPVLTCDTTHPGGEPANIHELRPWDIDLLGALGDSITAGFGVGAESLAEVAIQNRGESWSIGGDRSLFGDDRVVTLTNIVRQWNPDVEGFAVGTGGTTGASSGLNRAVGGATNRNMLDQADNLISRIKSDSRYDWDNDWKIITLFVGGNDLCASCRSSNYQPPAYRDGIEAALDRMHSEMPRTLVQVMAMFDITPLTELSTGSLCDLLQSGFCSCVTNPSTRPLMREYQMEYYNLLDQLISSGKYDTRDDFTVVLQPQMRDITPPKDENGEYYKDFLSYDCFHPSRPAHQMFALYMWDTMLTPVGEKPIPVDIDPNNSDVTCPREGAPYIYTNLNSARKVPKEEKAQPVDAQIRAQRHVMNRQ